MAARDAAAPAPVLSSAAGASSAAGDGGSELAAVAAAEQAAAAAAAEAALAAAREERDAARTRVREKLHPSLTASLWLQSELQRAAAYHIDQAYRFCKRKGATQAVSLALFSDENSGLQESEASQRAEGFAEELKRAQGSAAELSKALMAQNAERRAAERSVKDAEVRLSAAVSARQRSDARYEARIQVHSPGRQRCLGCQESAVVMLRGMRIGVSY